MSSSQVTATGNDENNKTGASVMLFGMQAVDIRDNHFVGSKPVRVLETVGEPVTTIADNRYIETPEPKINSGLGDR